MSPLHRLRTRCTTACGALRTLQIGVGRRCPASQASEPGDGRHDHAQVPIEKCRASVPRPLGFRVVSY
eukprot:4108065-Pyramimonas_sp.AAC.2